MCEAIWNPRYLTARFNPVGNPERPWVIVGAHSYSDDHLNVLIPDQFRTDLTSYPRKAGWLLLILWAIGFWYSAIMPWVALVGILTVLGTDPYGKELRASVFHDAAYAEHRDKFKSDAMYRIIMRNDGVVWWRRVVNYWGVFIFGWIPWLLNKRVQGMP